MWGSGLVCGVDGMPLRPGGLELTETLLDLARFAADDFVVDVGCGQGAGVAALLRRGCLAVGVDLDPEAVATARARVGGAAVVHAPGDAMPFADGSADGILAECSLSVMPDRAAALAEWRRVLRAGARIAISDVYRRVDDPDRVSTGLDLSPLVSWSAIAADLDTAGFSVEWFEDRSEVLREWVARFIFAHGSLEALWGGACGLTAEAVRLAAPGYFMAIAERRGEER
jgi:SAM-dependent methyltransferase